jgi:uroporphyrinogen decarboxylase
MLFAGGAIRWIWFYEDMGYKRPVLLPGCIEIISSRPHDPVGAQPRSAVSPPVGSSTTCARHARSRRGSQVIEVKAGMDLLRLYRDYGDRLSFMGGIDVRVLYNNDRAEIDAELEAKIPTVMGKYGYILHSDHSIPSNVDHDIYRYFIEKGLELGTYPAG